MSHLRLAAPAWYLNDLDKFTAFFAACGCMVRNSSGWLEIDLSKAPADKAAEYTALKSRGYSNGWE